jgi:hypothetical protein
MKIENGCIENTYDDGGNLFLCREKKAQLIGFRSSVERKHRIIWCFVAGPRQDVNSCGRMTLVFSVISASYLYKTVYTRI